ncbi:transcription elongation factor A protein 1-like isoform X2 [Patiria miniata]|uniref:Transcription elongation factor n=1 Tax=Patiria miniata TaxID=46514 RepID=A0A914A2Z9_PATMI|nr:transcription elongation factor A protein 1-like isoform X2 [Patiria miniata]
MSSCEREVVKIGKQLDKLLKSDTVSLDALDHLNKLKELPISLEILQKTRIGMSVNSLRKQSGSEDVNTLAKSLIKGWKKLLTAQQGPNKSNSSQEKKKDSGDDSREPSPPPPNGSGDGKSSGSEKGKSFPPAKTNDVVREKCVQMIVGSLKVPIEGCDTEVLGDVDEIAAEIEDCVYTEFVNTDMKYKNRIRSRVSNLKDTNNPELRRRVLTREITPEQIAKMTSDEMASKELKSIRDGITKEAIKEHQMAVTGGTKTDLLKCGKCLKRHCSYNQVQTRSADEPMTTFVYCHNCGNRWKVC